MKYIAFGMLYCICSLPSLAQSWVMGADYYPEHYPLQQVSADAVNMRKAGLQVVRMADFAWSLLQPNATTYHPQWLKKAVDTLGAHGIASLIATPTAAIPKWMYDAHGDIMQVTENGSRKPYGKRRHACLNHPVYRQYVRQLATQLATTFSTNPYVTGFQIDNELMAEEPYCYCNYCQKAFAKWLQHKYTTVNALNEAWGLRFWSQNIRSFAQVFLPRKGDNPGCFTDYQHFYSDCTIDFFNLQRNAIKQVNPRFQITHNICSSGFLYKLDLYQLAKYCDVLSIDNYPFTWTLENEYGPVDQFDYHPAMASMALSQIRGTLHKPFWVTEAQIARTAGKQRKIIPPGMVRLWSHQEKAHGASAVLFFPYRTFEAAHEHMMSGIMDADNIPRRRFFEVQQTTKELANISNLLGKAFPIAKAAVIRDFHCDWAFEDGRFSADFRYMRHVYTYYRALREKGITTNVIAPTDSLDGYSIIIVPSQVVLNPQLLTHLQKAAEKGSIVLLTCMTGLRNTNMHSFGKMLHSGVEQLAGIAMKEQYSLIQAEKTAIQWDSLPTPFTGSLWYDVFDPQQTQVMATYTSRFLQQQPAITKRTLGKGQVWYIGTIPSVPLANQLVHQLVQNAHLIPLASANSPLVEVTELQNQQSRYVYLINFSDSAQTVTLATPMLQVLTQQTYQQQITLPPMEVAVLKPTNP
jgi:beta-galactosidase